MRVSHPPTVYMQEIAEPKLTGKTNADIANYAVELKSALRLANSDKAALRQWLNDYQVAVD